MNIFFRVDSSSMIGAGHIMRCSVLAESLRDQGHQINFICRELPNNYISILEAKNFSVLRISGEIQTEEFDALQTITYLSKLQSIDWVIVDHYALGHAWQSACRNYTKRIMVIDDLANRIHACDLLLDQNYYANGFNPYTRFVPKDCKVFIGPRYALLRPEFLHERKILSYRDGDVKRILVSLGRTQAYSTIRKVLAGIELSNCRNITVDVVLGSATNLDPENISYSYKNKKNYHFYEVSNNMAFLMKNADLAIGAGGITTWERCCVGLPTLIIQIAHNQSELIKQGLTMNCFDYLGEAHQLNEIAISEKINEITQNPEKLVTMSKNAMELVDGLGVNRLIKEMMAV